ncbi:uncharacterized protein LOC110191975 [Drosophila serrata]|uniref:uncharacterized protein LOC110191975 n=1 Tax=Drosophila serrata TaxID=7274 RepID=UPI000A1D1D60|nr:uncharacterized protein LOC110191975 [Drosophila serrata]
MCICLRLSNRIHCVLNGISIIIICCVPLSFIILRGTYGANQCMLLAGLIITIIGALILIFGAVIKMRIPVFIWIVLSLPATLIVVTGLSLILRDFWDDHTLFSNSLDIIFEVLYICMILESVCSALRFLRELKREDA